MCRALWEAKIKIAIKEGVPGGAKSPLVSDIIVFWQ